jgi:hypothetical protein
MWHSFQGKSFKLKRSGERPGEEAFVAKLYAMAMYFML